MNEVIRCVTVEVKEGCTCASIVYTCDDTPPGETCCKVNDYYGADVGVALTAAAADVTSGNWKQWNDKAE